MKLKAQVPACLNYSEAVCPEQIKTQSVCIDGNCAEVLRQISTPMIA